MKINLNEMIWTRAPKNYSLNNDKIEIITEPHTDLWQRTYYHFRNDNAPVLQMKTREKYFSFEVKTCFESKVRFDQCVIVLYLNSDNWLKASLEFENNNIQRLGSVVTNNGYSDWASNDIDAKIKTMWFRLSRRENDFLIENSIDGIHYKQMRICHMFNIEDEINFGIYACSPENSSFKASFTDLYITECKWKAHDGQKPDKEYEYVESMELKFLKYQSSNCDKKKMKKLYFNAFPKNERCPYSILISRIKKHKGEYLGIYDNDIFIGLIYNIIYQDIVYIYYFAIEEKYRGLGYGSEVLSLIKEKYKDKRIVLMAETLDSNALNYKERIKRNKFYLNNGFIFQGYTVREVDVIYDMLGKTNKTVEKNEYKGLVKYYFGKFLYENLYKKISDLGD